MTYFSMDFWDGEKWITHLSRRKWTCTLDEELYSDSTVVVANLPFGHHGIKALPRHININTQSTVPNPVKSPEPGNTV